MMLILAVVFEGDPEATNVWKHSWFIVHQAGLHIAQLWSDAGLPEFFYELPAHIDAAAAATALLAGISITAVQLREATADLQIDFAGGVRLEIIPLSSGYESWQWTDPAGYSYFVQGGGNIVRCPKP